MPDIDDVAMFEINNASKLYIYPYMIELPAIIRDIFKSILSVGYDIPRLESVMSGLRKWKDAIAIYCIVVIFAY